MDARRAMRGQAFGASEPSHGSPPACRVRSQATGAVNPLPHIPAAGEPCIRINPLLGGAETSQRPRPDRTSSMVPMCQPCLHAGMTNCTHDKLHARTPSLPPVDGAAPRSVPQRRRDEGGGRAAYAAYLALPPFGRDACALHHCRASITSKIASMLSVPRTCAEATRGD